MAVVVESLDGTGKVVCGSSEWYWNVTDDSRQGNRTTAFQMDDVSLLLLPSRSKCNDRHL